MLSTWKSLTKEFLPQYSYNIDLPTTLCDLILTRRKDNFSNFLAPIKEKSIFDADVEHTMRFDLLLQTMAMIRVRIMMTLGNGAQDLVLKDSYWLVALEGGQASIGKVTR